jgi:hypothetical protein
MRETQSRTEKTQGMYKIMRNIPLPARKGGGRGFGPLGLALRQLPANGCFDAPSSQRKYVYAAARRAIPGMKIAVRPVSDDVIRVWRVK